MKREKNIGAERRVQSAKGKGQRTGSQKPEAGRQRAEGREQGAKRKERRAKNTRIPECGTTDNNFPVSQFDNFPVSQFDNLTNEISTVFQIKKPSATETRFPAEGCISEPQAIRACLTIRVFNN
jgi:hypothetical protein